VISIKHLVKRFDSSAGATLALDDLSVEIEPNSFFTLLGPSGCGKSTLLRCLAGLEHPDGGVIEIGGVSVFDSARRSVVPSNRRNIGMVFQSYAIWPHMTVGQNVAFPLEVQRRRDITRRVGEALELVGLGGLEGRYAAKLSGGQQQRVALARAIVAEPKVLLLDEPLSNLDAALRDQMRAELSKIQRALNVTTIYVTHDQTEALSMSDRIAVMAKGKFIEIATPHELYTRPRTAFAARFVGGANLFEGVAERQGGLSVVTTELGRITTAEATDGQVTLFVRIEHIERVDPANTHHDPTSVNRFRCRVVDRRYVGEATEFDLAPAEGASTTLVRCRFAADSPEQPGATLTIGIAPQHVHVLQPQ
jgi:iron(III) transport system ATP-binding protein